MEQMQVEKSKLMDALMFMRRFVISSSKDSQKGDPISVEPFRLSSETENAPSEFEVTYLFKKHYISLRV